MSTQPDKYCDLVMKGGLTSGVVYPSAVLELRKNFRFKNIGGTSAGAIAAAVSAAAAVGDRKKATLPKVSTPEKVGFEGLETIAKDLARQGFVYSLFQPKFGARNAYRIVVVLAGKSWLGKKLIVAFFRVIAIAPLEFLLALTVLLGWAFRQAGSDGVCAAFLPAVVCAYGVALAGALVRVAGVVRKNLLGLCSGLGVRRRFREQKPALTEWLHEKLQELSGKPLDKKGVADPLTFGDLRKAPRYDDDEPETDHAINLSMITSGISHREPRTLPFERGEFWFLKEQFEVLFPKSVVAWMMAQGKALPIGDKTYYPLPRDDALPVLVAMRMSLSFPLLLSAVPLHEACEWEEETQVTQSVPPEAEVKVDDDDFDEEDDSIGPVAATRPKSVAQNADRLSTGGGDGDRKIKALRVCWFSDGGISSNFPVHLFDSPLPLWPTFAINLVYPESDDTDRTRTDEKLSYEEQIEASVYFPGEDPAGWQHTYQSISHRLAAWEVAGFAFGIISTMQNWRDLLLARAPGQRDRIAHVSLWDMEGGMNLNMPQPVLKRIFDKGAAAGRRFNTFSFERHYWIRWRNLASALQRYTKSVARTSQSKFQVPAYAAAYQSAVVGVPVPMPIPLPPSKAYAFAKKQRHEANFLLSNLTIHGMRWSAKGPDLSLGAPEPPPQMQMSPIY